MSPSGRRGLGWALASLLALGACRSPGPPLVCVSDLDHPPFAALDDAGQPVGFEVDLMQALAEALGRELIWERRPFGELFAALEAGVADVACATLGSTPERRARLRFTRPYFRTGIALIELGPPGTPAPRGDLTGVAVGYAAGTTAEEALRSALPEARAVALVQGESPIDALTSGRVAAVAIDAIDLPFLERQADVRQRGPDLAPEDYALVLALGREELTTALDRILGRMEAQGRLEALWRPHAP